ncbi:Hydroxyacylglutathione hydrolase [Shimia sp. SK013]|uniref:MBL fold metallo-hydrolase n=1 Tax=Shimia sp. SK013 TaxID=1389006 RepID=UPI0006B57FF7|nr:MBL fold metallo-hydrolase [Shimia sp. SK013]KPA22838.1 Hydroxyacylglutathione hydrolase [Shimia sp. SK013]
MTGSTRRNFLKQAASASAIGVLPTLSLSETSIGKGSLITVSDGHLMLPTNMVIDGVPKSEATDVLELHGITGNAVTPSCNTTVYRDGENTVLFDVGAGPDFMPTAGQLTDNLAVAGISPEDVTHVLLTHAHPDHIWGLLDDFDDPMFANATHFIGRREWDYWWNPETVNTIGDARVTFAAGARRRLQMMEDQFVQFDNGDEVVSGVAALATHGHTPGHMSFEVRSGSEATLIIGDAIVNHHLAFHHPEWPTSSDQDADMGIQTRVSLFDRILADDLSVVGFHFPGSGMGRVEKYANIYRFVGDAT